MEALLQEILETLRAGRELDGNALTGIIRRHNEGVEDNGRHLAKKQILPYYFRIKSEQPERWKAWHVTPELEEALVRTLRMKPRRTASGVATITVLTKPWPCAGACLYCPNDVRMPKSYLADEPACQRAERNFFDPYLQVVSRLRALVQMGHVTDKVELIVLGGTWTDYPESYQVWFITELFRALNDARGQDALDADIEAELRAASYRELGIASDPDELASQTQAVQRLVDNGACSYNEAVRTLYGGEGPWHEASQRQSATLEELITQQRRNETAEHRVVGLVVETRPDTVTPEQLKLIRRLGCTKVQVGIQSIRPHIRDANLRPIDPGQLQKCLELLRLFGFKLHTHLMVNLFGSTPEEDMQEFDRFATDPAFMPDEVKLYPCALVEGTGLMEKFHDGSWQPYTTDELMDVLVHDTLATPSFMRISRMIRDISSDDIVAGNKKTNLRQMVEQRVQATGQPVHEIRYREIGTQGLADEPLAMDDVAYDTTVTREHFLQWTTPDGHIAGFARLSLPRREAVEAYRMRLPITPDQAMIREVHVYGAVAKLEHTGRGAQHLGLGRALIGRALEIARDAGFGAVNVISSVGTREYYRHLGFHDGEFYQVIKLDSPEAQSLMQVGKRGR